MDADNRRIEIVGDDMGEGFKDILEDFKDISDDMAEEVLSHPQVTMAYEISNRSHARSAKRPKQKKKSKVKLRKTGFNHI
jgi:hypothetical protein